MTSLESVDVRRTSTWQERYLARFYSPASGFINGTAEFHQLCRGVVPPSANLLEIGAGPSNATSRFLATLGTLHGLDIDPAVQTNDALASAQVFNPRKKFPFPDRSFDACFSNYVCEHVDDPEGHLSEVLRVLKPGGHYVFRTPNLFHYVSVIASITPHWFHELVANRLRNLKDDSREPYPTFHRMNTRHDLARLANLTLLEIHHFQLVEKEPSYGLSSRALFLAFMAYERIVNSTSLFENFRANLFVKMRRPSSPHALANRRQGY